MTIWMVEINEVDSDQGIFAIPLNYVKKRWTHNREFYLTKEKADNRVKEIYEGMHKLIKFMPNVEVRVSTIEVIE